MRNGSGLETGLRIFICTVIKCRRLRWARQSTGDCDGCAKAQAAATGMLSAAERSYPTSEVRGRSLEDLMPEGRQPKGVIPRQRSGAAAESARL